MLCSKIVEMTEDGVVVNEYKTMREAAAYNKISASTVGYSVAHPGHIVKHTGTAFYEVEEDDHCRECRYGVVYETIGGKVYGCGYALDTGICRHGKWSECRIWAEGTV